MASDYSAGQFVATNTCPNTASSSRWLTEEVFKLIDIVQVDEAIYNPRNKYYFCRPYVENFWREVDQKLEKNPGASLAKWTNLRISFRREYTNYLEEKVPPCWSYFDRMFFLHPYLRKKHQQPKSLDTQVQDALAHLSSLSNRMQRERVVSTCTGANMNAAAQVNASNAMPSAQLSPAPQQLDNYLDYFDEPEPNHAELEEIIDREQRVRFQNHTIDSNDIKSECEDPVDDYETEPDVEPHHHHAPHEDDDTEEHELRPMPYEVTATAPSSTSTATSAASASEKRFTPQHQQQLAGNRLQHAHRLQMRGGVYDDARGMRSRSQELQGAAAAAAAVAAAASAANLQPHPNISFVRPTFSSKTVDMVSTTTHSGGAVATTNEPEYPASSSLSAATPSSAYLNQRHLSHAHHAHHQATLAQRLETNNPPSAVGTAAGVDLCDCKTDSDAMFLMSLLPDIQKLNGRDRGKIKIAFQNILQDYLYPD
ncbi:CG6276 [Drosophila busckii]|uniref:CG6276 n=1 Tax=Drosophila busckii TaxID=30019 RepID=A0A0M4F5Y5_DROBS|nr:uncharacterized protein LOC108602038 [Drosophila busckii]ALC47375.1 CG6276 [Drosophila busckii]